MTLVPPRWGTARRPDRPTRADDAQAAAEAFGVSLFAWQRHVFDTALEVDPATGHYAYRVVGVTVGRQNGKTLSMVARIGMELAHPGRQVGFTAQDRNLAFEKWDEHAEMIAESDLPVKRIIRGSGREHVEMENGSRYGIFTPSGRGARGKTLDLVVIDEALTHDMSLIAAVEPTMATKPDGQLWILSNAGDERSGLLSHYRNLGHELVENPDRDNAARLAWFEWAPHSDRFDPTDPDVWHQAIPTLAEELGVHESAVAQAAASQPADVFAREWLNVWPSTRATAVVDPEAWEACTSPLTPPPAGLVFGLDVAPDRDRAAIVACGVTRGRYVLEVVENREGVGWVHERCLELTRRHRAQLAIDGGTTAAGSFVAGLEAEGVPVVNVKMREYAHACGLFVDAITAGIIAHPADPELSDAVAVAAKRTLGDAWAWQRRATVNLCPLIAATLAHYGAVTAHAPRPAVV